jgi:AraC-like DNA-binding protein
VHDQLDQVMAYAMAELAAQDVGGGPMSAALLKLVLLALRRFLVSTNAWVERFSILSDPPIARAFAEMASRPSVPHTVQSLSHAVGLSRSAFMARFSAAFGESPMSLLRRLRMRHAADLLAANALSIDQVALKLSEPERLHAHFPKVLPQRPLRIPCQGAARLVRQRHADRRRDRGIQCSLTPALLRESVALPRATAARCAGRAWKRRTRGLDSANGPSTGRPLSDEAQSNVGAGEFAAYVTRDLFVVGPTDAPFASGAVIGAKRAARRA